jgi:multicomponent Na+:H+ antiporter subunit G
VIDTTITLAVALLVIVGAAITLIASIGILRLPDLFTRMHAVSKAGTAGSGLALVAVALYSSDMTTTIKCLGAIVFLFLTGPISAHLLAKAYMSKQGYPKEMRETND